MPKNLSRFYLFCQFAGWAVLLALLYGILPQEPHKALLITGIGLPVSHGLRVAILRFRWLDLPVRTGFLKMARGVLVAVIAAAIARWLLSGLFFRHDLLFSSLVTSLLAFGLILLSWAFVYCLMWYWAAQRRRETQLRVLLLRLEEMKREAK